MTFGLLVVIALYSQFHYKELCLEQNQFPLWPEQEDDGLRRSILFHSITCVALKKTATSYLYHLRGNRMISRICNGVKIWPEDTAVTDNFVGHCFECINHRNI